MTSLRDQQKLDGAVAPLILNVCNFTKAADGQPSLLSPDDARTLFHEFGHALHGMLSNVIYPSLSGTSVFTDFVELPSQLYEHWQERPEVLQKFARHYQTGEPLPEDLLQRFLAARKFNQSFATIEFLSSALIDLEFHTPPAEASRAVRASEEAGDIFDPAVAKRLPDDIYSSGGSVDPEAAYVAFRGREPEPDALLRRRGLLDTPEAA